MTENQTLPVRLDYPDAQPISLDIARIRGAGTRIRRRRRIAATATAGVLALTVSAGAVALRPSSSSPEPEAGAGRFPRISSFLAADPPVRDPVVISAWPPHWTTVAWATANGAYCRAAFRTPAAGTITQSHCEAIEGDLNADFAVGATVGMPLPAMVPREAHQTYDLPGGQPDEQPFVGVTRGQVAQVAVVVRGQTYTAAVTPLTTWQGSEIGVFQLWIATGGGWNSEDVQSVIAYDSHGAVLARQGPWIPPTKPAG